MGGEVPDEDKILLKAAAELLWKKGINDPHEAAIAMRLTKLVETLWAIRKPNAIDKVQEAKP